MKNIKLTFLAVFALMFYSCDMETDLEVLNEEEPTSEELANEATADQLFQSWYNTKNNYTGPGLVTNVMADQITMSWGNMGMWDMSSEPRVEWNNSSSYGSRQATESYFNAMNAILSDANALAFGVENGMEFSDLDKYESLSRFGQGAAIGSLALIFDRVYVFDETGTLNDGEPYPFNEAVLLALEKLDLAIAAADRGDFTLAENQVYSKSLSSDEWSQFLNTLAARMYVNSARNATQKAALDWDRILTYAENGLTYDFAVGQDGWSQWWPDYIGYSIYPGWGRVDMRIIGMMADDYPSYWPDGQTSLPPATSPDSRFEDYFQYLDYQDYPEDRGTYHWSTYRQKRWDDWLYSGFTTDLYEMLQAENETYKAEAHLWLNDPGAAAAVLNSMDRGGLPDVPADNEAVADAIHYERMVELMNTGMGLGYYEMRGKDLLEPGTLLHFPIPGAALDAAGIPYYTFGGTTGTPGEDYSVGGWR